MDELDLLRFFRRRFWSRPLRGETEYFGFAYMCVRQNYASYVMKYALDRKLYNTRHAKIMENLCCKMMNRIYLHYLKDPIVVLRHI